MIWNIVALVLLLIFRSQMNETIWVIAMIVNAIVFAIGAYALYRSIHIYRVEQRKEKERLMAMINRYFGD